MHLIYSLTEEYSGVSGLPPPRSLEQERWKEEYARQHPGARVRVFVPQKYNSPMDLYSAPNVVDSFQQQATGYFEELERLVAIGLSLYWCLTSILYSMFLYGEGFGVLHNMG